MAVTIEIEDTGIIKASTVRSAASELCDDYNVPSFFEDLIMSAVDKLIAKIDSKVDFVFDTDD